MFDQITAMLAPHICVGCSAEGRLLCLVCAQSLPRAVERCYRCQQASSGGKTCQSCRRKTKLTRVRALTRYEGAAKTLVWQLKFERAKAGGVEIGRLLAPLLEENKNCIVVHTPTATSRVWQRGYDQAAIITRVAARRANVPCAVMLLRVGQRRQVGGNRQQRQQQMADVFRVRNPDRVRGARILLVDDVITTGATLEAAATALKAAGARSIEAAVFAQA